MRIAGVYPPIATPFNEQGHLDSHALAVNIRKWNSTGLSGYIVAGSNGESALLEDTEVIKAIQVVKRAALPQQLVIAGTGRQSTKATVELTAAAADAGSDAALVVTPSFYSAQMTPSSLQRYYEAVAEASPIPLMIYNVPKFTHLNIAAKTVAQLAQHENIVGIKDSAGDIGQVVDLVRLCPAEFCVLIGNGPAFYSGLQAGASGGILALANVAPSECVEILRLVSEGSHEAAREIHFRLMPVGRAVTSGFGVPGLKAALDLLGFHGGMPRPPLFPADDSTRQTLHEILTSAQLLR